MSKVRLKRYIPQVDERDCGVAALSMVANQYGTRLSLARLREEAKTDLDGTTALGIVRASDALGFETRAIRANMSLFDEPGIPLPFIAHVNKEGKFLHYYVVYGYNDKYIWTADPDRSVSKTKMTRARFEREWSGVSIFIGPKPEYKPAKDSRDSFFSFLPIVFKQKELITLVVLAALLVTVISIAGSYYLQAIIDTYIPDGMKNTLGIMSLGLIVTYIVQQLLSFARDYLLVIMGQRLSIDVILSYIKHLFELPMSFYATRRTGEITSRFGDANSIIDAVASTILTMFLDVGTLVIVGSVLVIQNTQLFFITLASLPLYVVIVLAFKKPFEKMNNDTMQSNSMLNSSIIEDINGMETIKALTGEQASYQKVDREFVEYLYKSFIYQKATALQSAIKSGTKLILNVAVLWVGAQLVMKNTISVGQLVTYNALLGYFTDPLQSIIDLQTKLQAASVANNRLNEVYLVSSEFDTKSTRLVKARNGDIQLNDIVYKYGFGRNALDHVSLDIKENSKVAMVGVSGSGKSTLVKSIIQFIQPESGQIFIGGQDIAHVDKTELRRLVTYVPQSPFIFTGSVRENLLLGADPDATNEDVVKALEIAQIQSDIEQMPQGFETEISEDGGMSGGQKQRIAIARALLTKSPILILDESTSALDVLTEKNVIDNLMQLDKTIIFVAHRLTIAERSEQVIVMSQGQVVESGTHKDLLATDGFYAQLVNH
ncbi:peptide cleavage/export ABC transporter [Weissella cibaria]|uniref:peptide cleavage/export ABC transporter n=1 Tax=Weissella cibaria TaxID=137591 RepID=UPI001CD4F6A7|nr:peptide cleavage/export ABC transporter [Weissella cibaria]MCA1355694.1 peptide cleavage/export ABC transporter [Weissella cibaria]MDQ2124965.1 peptide cleavage/export ABC transporter [Weissella cibaria]MDQ2157399.1 peptide cleavage/export ABC transporter [Weissella cibaria]